MRFQKHGVVVTMYSRDDDEEMSAQFFSRKVIIKSQVTNLIRALNREKTLELEKRIQACAQSLVCSKHW